MRPAAKAASGACAFVLLLAMAACASGPAPVKWEPRTDADLKTDLAACEKDVAGVDHRTEEAYSDSRYGAAAAMSGRLNQNDMTGGTIARMQDAIMFSCMTRKGWKQAQ